MLWSFRSLAMISCLFMKGTIFLEIIIIQHFVVSFQTTQALFRNFNLSDKRQKTARKLLKMLQRFNF